MRAWGKNIEIDGSYYNSPLARSRGLIPPESNVAFYEKTVQDLMRDLEKKSTVSMLVVLAINSASHDLRIIPLTLAEAMSPANGGSWPVWTNYMGAFPKNIAVCGTGSCDAVAGPGSDVVLNYEPYSSQLDFADDPGGNRQPDDALLHELVHCLRIMRGLYNNIPASAPYDRSEEFFAILITNMYLGQVGRLRSLRGTYTRQFIPNTASPADFAREIATKYKREMDRLASEMPDLCAAFRTMDLAWNPFKVAPASKP